MTYAWTCAKCGLENESDSWFGGDRDYDTDFECECGIKHEAEWSELEEIHMDMVVDHAEHLNDLERVVGA